MQFVNKDHAERALEKNKQSIGHRCAIEQQRASERKKKSQIRSFIHSGQQKGGGRRASRDRPPQPWEGRGTRAADFRTAAGAGKEVGEN